MGKKILIADDECFIRDMLKVLLTRAGYDLIFAEDGQSAVEMAKAESPDLVLIDGLMPKMHGFLACKAIKEQDAPPKIIILTAVYTKPSYRWEVKNTYSADDILVKPFKAADLLACIQKHLPGSENLSALTSLIEKLA
jgi:DNA-binding response OmpR family regulator